MDAFLQGVTASVMLNAGVVEEQYKITGLSIDESLVTPWTNAAIKMQEYADVALPMMNEWTSEKGFFGQFSSTASGQLVGPWAAGAGAAEQFRLDSSKIMSQIVSNIQQNVVTAQGQLKSLYDDIIKTQKKAAEGATFTTTYKTVYQTEGGGDAESMQKTGTLGQQIIIGDKSTLDSKTVTVDGKKYYKHTVTNRDGESTDYYYDIDEAKLIRYDGGRSKGYAFVKGTNVYKYYAKGTTATKKDQWAIDSEPQFGDEIVLVPGKDGLLSYMRKGTAVIPADISENLMKIGMNPNLANMSSSIIKPTINNVAANNTTAVQVSFDALVKADNITNDVLPEVEKMVSKQLDKFTRSLNYSLRKVGAN